MGGARNVALSMMDQRSKSKTSLSSGFPDLQALLASRKPMTQKEHEQNLRSTGRFVAFIVTGSLCIAFFIHFRTYHASLEKLDQLTALFNNPNARVASGDQGKRILKKLGVGTEAEKQEDKQLQLNETLEKVAELLKNGPKVEPPTPKLSQIVEETNQISSYQVSQP